VAAGDPPVPAEATRPLKGSLAKTAQDDASQASPG